MRFDQLLFDDFEYIIQNWSKETGKNFIKEESFDGTIEYVYDVNSFRRWYHENSLQIERDEKLKMIFTS
jgi:hypothetical protein